jgi:LSD1 subclass zinc finger protein
MPRYCLMVVIEERSVVIVSATGPESIVTVGRSMLSYPQGVERIRSASSASVRKARADIMVSLGFAGEDR